MTEDTNALPMGFSLHRYLVESVLGAGGFGITYRAIHEALQNQVAIKEYFPAEWAYRDRDGTTVRPNAQGQIPARSGEPACYEWGLQRFLHEAKVLVQINHPGVVRVRDYFAANGSAYIVMEYEGGESLSTLLQRGGILPEHELHHLLDDVMPALEAVHGQGYLHRDLKPSNLYIRSADARVMLIDFGAARQALGQRTRSVTSVVTPGYSPIEQYVTVGEDYGPWTDIYALGAVLYRCITGAPPIEAPGRVLKDPVLPAVECGAGLYSHGLLRVVDQALAVRPEDRFQTIAAMREALRIAGRSSDPVDFPQASQPPSELLNLNSLREDLRLDLPSQPPKPPEVSGANDPWSDVGRMERQSHWRFEEVALSPATPSQPSNRVAERVSAPSEKLSGWTLADFDTQNPAPAAAPAPAPERFASEGHEASLSMLEDVWDQLDRPASQPAPPPLEEHPLSQPRSQLGDLSPDRPSRLVVEPSKPVSSSKSSPIIRTELARPETPLPASKLINRFEESNRERPPLQTEAQATPESEAIAYDHRRPINWKWVIILAGVISALSGVALLGYYEYTRTAQEAQRRLETAKQEQEEIERHAREEAQRQAADIADRTQKFRSNLANKNLIAAELNLERMAEAYPNHPALELLQSEFRAAQEQGINAKSWTEEKTGIKLIWIDGGCANMGSPLTEQDRGSDESLHQICVKGFWIGATEISNSQYRRFKPDHDSGSFQGRPLNRDTQPVINVTWNNAKAFTEWLSWEAGTGKRFRLPTEAEWEYAARATTTTRYYWGNDIDPRYANFSDRNDPSGASVQSLNDGQAVTAPVGSYLSNRFGLSDMAGNVWEWTCSEYDRNYSGQEQGCSDRSANEGLRVVRGGSWNNGPGDLRSAKRLSRKPDYRDTMTGFRVVMEE